MKREKDYLDLMIEIAYKTNSEVVVYPKDSVAVMTSMPSDDPDTPLILYKALVDKPDTGNPEHWKSFMYA